MPICSKCEKPDSFCFRSLVCDHFLCLSCIGSTERELLNLPDSDCFICQAEKKAEDVERWLLNVPSMSDWKGQEELVKPTDRSGSCLDLRAMAGALPPPEEDGSALADTEESRCSTPFWRRCSKSESVLYSSSSESEREEEAIEIHNDDGIFELEGEEGEEEEGGVGVGLFRESG